MNTKQPAKDPYKDQIKEWLTAIGRDRQWLAGKLHVGKRTVDNWLSSTATIPPLKCQTIAGLMATETRDLPALQQPLVLILTAEQYAAWDRASRRGPYAAETLTEWVITGIDALAAEAYPELSSVTGDPATDSTGDAVADGASSK